MTKKKKIKKQKLSEKLRKNKYPFVVEADPLTGGPPLVITHTHGLNEIGWPEFIFDPLAFGPDGNADKINAAYSFFKKPKNKKKLESILNGETIEIPIKTLIPKWRNAPLYTLCFRRVSNDFEAVKQAYDTDGSGVDPKLVVVQIYVKGDDYG